MHACELWNSCRLGAGLRAHRFERTGLGAIKVDAACTGKRCDVDGRRSRFYEGLRGCTGGSTSGEDVIDEQDVPVLDCGRVRDFEGATDVETALTECESSLALGRAQAHESGRRKGEMPSRMRLGKSVNGAFSQSPGLVESTLFVFAAVQRNGYDKQLRRSFRGELRDGGCEHRAEAMGGWMDAVILQCVDGGSHGAVVGAEGNRACK